MPTWPKISVIIPFYNCEYVNEAIDSALQQNYPNFEIIVVDDGSTSEQDKLSPYLDRIRYFKKKNGGTASALNFGIKKAKGEYFAWLSADDRFLPYKLVHQFFFMRQEGAKASFSSFYFMNAEGERTSEAIRCLFPNKKEFYKLMQKGCPVNGCTVILHMDVFKKIGMFDEKKKFTHDYDFWLRMLRHFDFLYIDEPLVDYRVHGKMGTLVHQQEIDAEIKRVQGIHQKAMQALIKQEGGA